MYICLPCYKISTKKTGKKIFNITEAFFYVFAQQSATVLPVELFVQRKVGRHVLPARAPLECLRI
jgi:hypothetical protein